MFKSILRTLVGCYLVTSLTQTVSAAPAPAQKIFVTMGKDLSHHVFTEKSNKIVSTHDDLTVVEITPEDFEKISHSLVSNEVVSIPASFSSSSCLI